MANIKCTGMMTVSKNGLVLESGSSTANKWTLAATDDNLFFYYNGLAVMKLNTDGRLDVLSVNLTDGIEAGE